ncbi:MAG: guanylate kinase [Pseudomonadota bacterium]
MPDTTDAKSEATRRGLMFVLSSPSGAGKSTIAAHLIKNDPDLKLSISVTTRPRRSSEIEGVHYFFRSKRDFEKMVERKELIEWAEVHGNYYGTPRQFVEDELSGGRDVLFDVDVQGAKLLRKAMPDDIATVFILPPSVMEMKSRLKRRAEDSDEAILKRMTTALDELKNLSAYDYLVVNDDLEKAMGEVKAILVAERLRRVRQGGNRNLAEQLHRDLQAETADAA